VSPPRPCLTTTPGRNLLGPARGTTSPSWSTSPPPRARCPRKGLPLYPRTRRPCTGRFDLRLAQLLHHCFLHLRRRHELFPLHPSIVSLARISIRRGRCLCRLVPSLTLVRHRSAWPKCQRRKHLQNRGSRRYGRGDSYGRTQGHLASRQRLAAAISKLARRPSATATHAARSVRDQKLLWWMYPMMTVPVLPAKVIGMARLQREKQRLSCVPVLDANPTAESGQRRRSGNWLQIITGR
jgi:hypothetical protein